MNAVTDIKPFDPTRFVERFKSIQVIPYESRYLSGALQVAREIHRTSIYRDFPLNEAKLIRQLSAAGTSIVPERYFKVAVRNGEVLGGFYGCVMRTFFCDEIIAKDMGWWVRSTSRGGAAAILLLIDFENWARAQGARLCTIGQSGIENHDRTGQLFRHCGYEFSGYNAAKDLLRG